MYLNCHTFYSYKYGTLSVQELLDEARRCKVKKLVLTEINNTASYIEMLRLYKGNKTKATSGPGHQNADWSPEVAVGVEVRQHHELLYVAIARNNQGFQEINRFLSQHSREQNAYPRRAPEFSNAVVIYPYGAIEAEGLRDFEYVGVRRSQLGHLRMYPSYQHHPGKFVAFHPVTFKSKTGFNVHRLLRAIDLNTLLSKLAPHHQASADEFM